MPATEPAGTIPIMPGTTLIMPVQGHVAVHGHDLDTELEVLIEVVAINGVACSLLWIELHATEQQTGS